MRWLAAVLAIAAAVTLGAALQQKAQAAPPSRTNPSPFVVTRSGSTNTYTATSLTTGQRYTGTLKSVVEQAVADLERFSAGGTVRFSAGTFDLGSDFFKLDGVHDLVFEGQGPAQTLIKNVNSDALDSEPFNMSVATRVTIRDLTVSAGGEPRTTSDAIDFDDGSHSWVDNVDVISSRARGIIFDGKGDAGQGIPWAADYNVVSDCRISGTQSAAGDGIEFLASNHNEVYGCTITGVVNDGINITKASTLAFSANKPSDYNYVHDNTIVGAGRHGIAVNSSSNNRIENNTLEDNGASYAADGVRIDQTDGVLSNANTITGNVATDRQATPTQQFGLNIADALCANTVVGANALDGNVKAPIQDLGTGTVYLTDTLPFADGFESGDLSRWSRDNGLVAEATTVSAGSWAAEGQVAGGTGVYARKQLSPSKTNVYYALRFRVASHSGVVYLLRLRNNQAAASPIAGLYVSTTGKLGLNAVIGGVSTSTTSTTAVSLDAWHTAELHVALNGASGTTEVWLDGDPVAALTKSCDLGATPIGWLELGDTTTTATSYDVFFDEVRAGSSYISDLDTTPPTAPTDLQAAAASGLKVDVTWAAATDDRGVTAYDVYRNDGLVGTTSGATSFSDTSVAPLTTYRYRVVARDEAGNASPFSPAVSVNTPDAFVDDFESGSFAGWTSVSGLTLQQSWVDPDGGLWAARETSDGTAGASAQARLDQTLYALHYRVRFEILSQGYGSVGLLRVRTAANGAIASAFVSSTGKLGYRNDVAGTYWTSEQSVSRGTWHELQMHAVVAGGDGELELWLDGTKIAADALDLGTTPIGRLELGDPSASSYDVALDSVVADPQFIPGWSGLDITPPTSPVNLAVTGATSTQIALSWDAATDNVAVTGYRIYRDGVNVGTVDGATTVYADTAVPDTADHSYTVTALDAANNESDPSDAVVGSLGDRTRPSAPTGLTATAVAGAARIDLGWDAATDNVAVTGYRIYRDGSSTPLATVDAPATSFSDTTVAPATSYAYTVTAVDAAGNESDPSSPATAVAADTVAPQPPASLTATVVSDTQVALAWSAATDNVAVTGYQIFRDGGTTPLATVGASPTSFTDGGLTGGTSYTYTVVALDAAGNASLPSVAAAVITFVFSDGFESGSLSRWTSSAAFTVQNANVVSGSWAGEARSNKNTASYALETLPATYPSLTCQLRVKLLTGKPDTVDVLALRTHGGGGLLSVYYDSKGRLAVRDEVTRQSTVSTTALKAGVWYTLKVRLTVGTAGSLQVWLNGTSVPQLTRSGVSFGTTPIGQLVVGETATGHAYDYAVDDVLAVVQ